MFFGSKVLNTILFTSFSLDRGRRAKKSPSPKERDLGFMYKQVQGPVKLIFEIN